MHLEERANDFHAQPRREASWHIGRQHAYEGDCLELLPRLRDETVDVVVTSPPYNLGIQYKTYVDSKPRTEYLSWLEKVAEQVERVVRRAGSLFLNVGSTNADPWVALDVANVFKRRFILQNHIVWVKSISIGEDTVGHFKPINSPRFLNQNHESIFHFTKTGETPIDRLAIGVPFKDKSNISRWGHKQDRRCAGNVWYIPYTTVRSKKQKYNHPAGFPVELAERCIRLHGLKDAKVFDPFLGTGSTLVAAQRLNCSGLGFEIDKEYVRVAGDRLKEEVS